MNPPAIAIRVEQTHRVPRVPMFAVVLAALWGCEVVIWNYFIQHESNGLPFCALKAVTGSPCPTCGSTRAVDAIAAGDFVGGWLCNPFMVTAIVIGILWLALRLVTGHSVMLVMNRRNRVVLWSVIAALFVGNWIYLIARGM